MNRMLTLLLFASSAVFAASTDKDIRVPQYNGTVGAWPNVTISPAVNSLMGFSSDKTAANVTVGSGLSLSAGSLTATGTGTVSSVSVTTANGVSGSVATATTTPAITLTLGAITPASVTSAGAVLATTGILGANAASVVPITLFVKSVTVLTAGTPADIATLTVPAGITRYRVVGSSAANSANMVVAETAAGTLGGASFQSRDAAAAGGNQLTSAISGPGSAGLGVSWSSNLTDTIWTASTIYIRQTSNSANAGTCSFYITIWPLP